MTPRTAVRLKRPWSKLPQYIVAVCLLTAALSGAAHAQYELWKINAEGGGLTRFAETPGYTCGSPDWSPDGKWLAYDTWKIGQRLTDSQVALLRSDGTRFRLLGPGAMPSWSPDGKQLVFHTYDSPQTIGVMNSDGSGREIVINHWGSPRWSPKGNRIASILNGGIGLFDMATGTERSILRGPYVVRLGFSICPDGLRFCFGDEDGGLVLATLDERTMTASVRPLVKQGAVGHTSWAPDGRRVVFQWQPTTADHFHLYIIDVDSKDPPRRLEGQKLDRHNVNADWSPDGKTIVFVSGR